MQRTDTFHAHAELRHPGHSPQSVHAGKGRSAAKTLGDPDGGFTVDHNATDIKTGWAVAEPGHSKFVSGDDWSAMSEPEQRKIIVDYIRTVPDDAMVGGWNNPATGEVTLDRVTVLPKEQKAEAVKLGQDRNQEAIASLDAIWANDWGNAFVDTGGSGDERANIPTHDQGTRSPRPTEEEVVGDDRQGTGRHRSSDGRPDQRQQVFYAHAEVRHPSHQTGTDQSVHGGKGGGARGASVDAASLITPAFGSLSPKLQRDIEDRITTMTGMSMEEMDAHILAQSTKYAEEAFAQYGDLDAVVQQSQFYENWNAREVAFTDQLNSEFSIDPPIEHNQMVAASAALASMQDPYYQIRAAHETAVGLAQDSPMDVSAESIADYQKWVRTPGTGREGKVGFEDVDLEPGIHRPSDLPAGYLASRMKYTDSAGVVQDSHGTLNAGDKVKAILILRGQDPNGSISKAGTSPAQQKQALGGAKLREYASAGADPRNNDSYVLDTWMLRANFEGVPIRFSKKRVPLTPAEMKLAKGDEGAAILAEAFKVPINQVGSGSGLNGVFASGPTSFRETPPSTGTYPRIKQSNMEATPAVEAVMRDHGYDGPPLTHKQAQAVVWAGIRVKEDGMPLNDPFAAGIDDQYFGGEYERSNHAWEVPDARVDEPGGRASSGDRGGLGRGSQVRAGHADRGVTGTHGTKPVVKDEVRHPGHSPQSVHAGKNRGRGGSGGDMDSQAENSTVTDGRRTYNAGRVADVHDPYVNGQKEGTTPVGQPTMTIMGGGTGAGKGTLLKSGQVDASNAVKADSDEAKSAIPEYRERNSAGDPKAASYAHEESSDMAKRLVAESLSESRNTILDGTGDSSEASLNGKIMAARASGARVVGEYVTISFDEARARNASRAANNPDRAIVPDEVLVRTHSSVSKVLPKAVESGVFDEVRLWDNTNGPKLVMESKNGKTEILDQKLWDDFVAKGSGPSGEGSRSNVVPGRISDLPVRIDRLARGLDIGNLGDQPAPRSEVLGALAGDLALSDGDAERHLGGHLDHVVTGHVHGADSSNATDIMAEWRTTHG